MAIVKFEVQTNETYKSCSYCKYDDYTPSECRAKGCIHAFEDDFLKDCYEPNIEGKWLNIINGIEADINDLRTNNADRNEALNDVLDVINRKVNEVTYDSDSGSSSNI